MEQIMARLLAEMRTNQEKTNANLKKMKANHEEVMAIMETNQEKMMAKLDARHERMVTRMDSQLENREACLEKTEVVELEANPEETETESEHQEVPNEEAAVETVGAPIGGPVTGRGMRNTRKSRTMGYLSRGAPEGPTVEKRRRKVPECNNGIKDRGARRKLHLRKGGCPPTEAGDRSHVWEARRHYLRPADKLTSRRSRSNYSENRCQNWPPPKRKKRLHAGYSHSYTRQYLRLFEAT
jgi:hypothetical protein